MASATSAAASAERDERDEHERRGLGRESERARRHTATRSSRRRDRSLCAGG